VTEPATKPLRTWRPMAAWTAGILLALGLVWFVGAVVAPVWQTDKVLRDPRPHPERLLVPYERWSSSELKPYVEAVNSLGGPETASNRLSVYLRTPRRIAPHKEKAIFILGLCGPNAVPALRRAIQDTDEGLRCQAIWALSQIGAGAQPAVADLQQALGDESDRVRSFAAEALKKIRGEEAKP